MTAGDAVWRRLAYGSRKALHELGYGIIPRCLPDEPDACGGSFAQHAMAHLATLSAVTDHHLAHLGYTTAAELPSAIYYEAAKNIDCEVTCGDKR